MNQNNKTIAKNTIFLSIRMVFVLGISLYTSRVILATLGVVDYGIYNVVCGFVTMFAFLSTSMNNAIQRFYNFEFGRNGVTGTIKVYNAAVLIQLIIAIITIILLETLGLWYIDNKMVIPEGRETAAFWVFQFSIASLFIVIVQVPYSAAIMAHEKMDFYALVSVCDVILKLAIVYLLQILSYDKLIIYGALMLFINISDMALYYVYSKSCFEDIKIEFKQDWNLCKNMMTFSMWNLFGSFSGVAKEQGLNMILNIFFGPVVNAARGIAYQVTGAIQGFVANITIAARPQLTQAYALGNNTRMFNIMYGTSKLCYLVLLSMVIPILFEVDYILKLWLGENVPENTNSFLVWVLLSSLVHVFNPITSFVVHATGNMKKYQIVTGLFNLTILPVAFWLCKLGANPVIVFILSFVYTLLGQVLCIYILSTLISFNSAFYYKTVWVPLLFVTVVSLVPGCVIKVSLVESFWRLVFQTMTAIFTIVITSYLFVLSDTEKNIASSFVKKIVHTFKSNMFL